MTLVQDTGLDAFDAGSLADSWRQQPGAPVYCTDLTLQEIGPALEAAERDRLPKRRDLGVAVMQAARPVDAERRQLQEAEITAAMAKRGSIPAAAKDVGDMGLAFANTMATGPILIRASDFGSTASSRPWSNLRLCSLLAE